MRPIDRLFERLALTYGNLWTHSLGGTPVEEVKQFWEQELAGFFKTKEAMMAIVYALDHLPEKTPNIIQFKNLCYQAPKMANLALPPVPANPEKVKAEISKIQTFNMGPGVDAKAWAHRILNEVKSGKKRPVAVVQMARDALEFG